MFCPQPDAIGPITILIFLAIVGCSKGKRENISNPTRENVKENLRVSLTTLGVSIKSIESVAGLADWFFVTREQGPPFYINKDRYVFSGSLFSLDKIGSSAVKSIVPNGDDVTFDCMKHPKIGPSLAQMTLEQLDQAINSIKIQRADLLKGNNKWIPSAVKLSPNVIIEKMSAQIKSLEKERAERVNK